MLGISYTERTGKRNFTADLCGRPSPPPVAAVHLPRSVVILKRQDGIYRCSVPEGRYYSRHICLTHFYEWNCTNISFRAYHRSHTVSKRPADVYKQVPITIKSVTWHNRHHTMKTCEAPSILILGTRWSWPTSRPGRFKPGERGPRGVKVKFTLQPSMEAQRGNRGIALLFLQPRR